MQLNDSELLAYLAGFFDGEGCIMITKRNTRNRYYLRLHCCNTHEEPLLLFARLFGGTVQKRRPFGASNLPSFYWQASYRYAQKALIALTPYLIVKKTRAELALEFCTIKPRVKSPTLTDDILAQKKIGDDIRLLNRTWNTRSKEPDRLR